MPMSPSAASSERAISLLQRSSTTSRTSGLSRTKPARSCGSACAITEVLARMRSAPLLPTAWSSITEFISLISISSDRAYGSSAVPAGVSSTPREERSNSVALKRCSSSAMRRLAAARPRCDASAALVRLRSSAARTKSASESRSGSMGGKSRFRAAVVRQKAARYRTREVRGHLRRGVGAPAVAVGVEPTRVSCSERPHVDDCRIRGRDFRSAVRAVRPARRRGRRRVAARHWRPAGGAPAGRAATAGGRRASGGHRRTAPNRRRGSSASAPRRRSPRTPRHGRAPRRRRTARRSADRGPPAPAAACRRSPAGRRAGCAARRWCSARPAPARRASGHAASRSSPAGWPDPPSPRRRRRRAPAARW